MTNYTQYTKPRVASEKETSETYATLGFQADTTGTFSKAYMPTGKTSDAVWHTDIEVLVKYNGRRHPCHVDVKSVTENNFNTGNYSISQECVDFLTTPEPVLEHTYMFAFRLVENGILTKKFLVVWAEDVMNLNLRDGGFENWLVSINDVKKLKDQWIIEPDIDI